MNDKQISEEAIRYIKQHNREIIQKFAGDLFMPVEIPISLFMAGSPGAGKTELSKEIINLLENNNALKKVVRIDPDEIREILPDYTGSNSHLFQKATTIAVDKIHDYVLEKRKNFILDATLAVSYDKAQKNIQRSLDKKRLVAIFYVYQNPLTAWDFVKKRERLEGRRVSKEQFVQQLFGAKSNVNRLKAEFGKSVELYLIEKDIVKNVRNMRQNIEDIDNYILIEYTPESLTKLLYD